MFRGNTVSKFVSSSSWGKEEEVLERKFLKMRRPRDKPQEEEILESDVEVFRVGEPKWVTSVLAHHQASGM